ncbi:MAG: hypothetical protein ABI833_02195 [Acidobacteriota bacterium]
MNPSNMSPDNISPGNHPSLLRSLRGPVVLVTLGTLFMIDHAGGVSIGRTWPVLLIVMGVMWLGEYLGSKNV